MKVKIFAEVTFEIITMIIKLVVNDCYFPYKECFLKTLTSCGTWLFFSFFTAAKPNKTFFCFLEGFPSYSQVERKKKPREETFVKSAGDSAECLVWGLP